MFSVEELRADADELCMLCDQARRSNVKNIISAEIRRLEGEIKTKVEEAKSKRDKNWVRDAVATDNLVTKKITTYAWDESEKFAKIYITAYGVHNIPKDQITSKFGDRSCSVVISGLNGSNHSLGITNLHDLVLPEESHHKIKTDSILLMMKKKTPNKNWGALVKKIDSKKEEAPKAAKADDKEDDPSAGIMNMMKKMYDEGDDEMKRMLNKTWAESQEKRTMGGGVPGEGDF